MTPTETKAHDEASSDALKKGDADHAPAKDSEASAQNTEGEKAAEEQEVKEDEGEKEAA